jgi:hypothetical protein
MRDAVDPRQEQHQQVRLDRGLDLQGEARQEALDAHEGVREVDGRSFVRDQGGQPRLPVFWEDDRARRRRCRAAELLAPLDLAGEQVVRDDDTANAIRWKRVPPVHDGHREPRIRGDVP